MKILPHIHNEFRKKISCTDAFNSVTEFMKYEIEGNEKGQACSIDLQKAFDTLDHEIQMIKLEKHGFRRTILEISDQFVCENGNLSIKLYVKTGVPHGYLLRTFLFLFYFNDLQRVARGSQIEFLADDTNMVKSGNNTDQKIDEEL